MDTVNKEEGSETSELKEIALQVLKEKSDLASDSLEEIVSQVVDITKNVLIHKLGQIDYVITQYQGKLRPCVDLAVVLDAVREKEFSELTDSEKDDMIALSSRDYIETICKDLNNIVNKSKDEEQ